MSAFVLAAALTEETRIMAGREYKAVKALAELGGVPEEVIDRICAALEATETAKDARNR